jgi:benzoylformate decarboxylase
VTAGAPSRTVRDAVVQVWRDCAMTTMFSNPGSTEIPLLAGLPDDIDFVLGLHEASVVGLATGAAASGSAAVCRSRSRWPPGTPPPAARARRSPGS